MKKYMIFTRTKYDDVVYCIPESNRLFDNYASAIAHVNRLLRKNGLPSIQRPMKEAALSIELPSEIIELWIIHTKQDVIN